MQMGGTRFAVFSLAAAFILACTTANTTQAPSPQPSTQTTPAPAGGPPAAAQPGMQGGPGGAPSGPSRRPNPMVQDTLRRAQVDSIMRTIAGRENEPAGQVFKNVKVLKDMPAGEFLKNMDVNYGRGLGMTCGNCHVTGQFDVDTRKNKRLARDMQEMVNYINATRLPQMKDIDEDYVRVSCVTCHAGSGHPKNSMPVPAPAAR
jgi:hypothetical protein